MNVINTTLDKRNMKKLLKEHDKVLFTIGVVTYVYEVKQIGDNGLFLNINSDNNDIIFKKLGVNKNKLVKECYGYTPYGGHWPQAKTNDFEAITKLVNKLHDLCNVENFKLKK